MNVSFSFPILFVIGGCSVSKTAATKKQTTWVIVSIVLAVAVIVLAVLLANAHTALSTTQETLDSTVQTLSATQSELNAAKGTLADTQSELTTAQDTLSATQSELTATKDTLSATQSELTSTKDTLSAMQSELTSTKDTLSATQSELTATKDTLSAMQSELTETKDILSATQSELRETKDALSTAQSELAATNDTLSTAQSELTETKDALSTAQSELATTNDALSTAQSELTETKDALSATQSELTATQDALSAVQSELTTTKDALSAAQSELTTSKDALSAAQSELIATQDALTSTQNELAAVKEELRATQESANSSTPASMNTTAVKVGSYEIEVKSDWQSYESSEEGFEYYRYGNGATFLMLLSYPIDESMPSSPILQRTFLKQALQEVSSGILSSGKSLSDEDYINLDNDHGIGIYCVAPLLGHDVAIYAYYSAEAPTELLCAIYADMNDLGDGIAVLNAIGSSAHAATPAISSVPAQSADSYTVDYNNAEDFEAALNSGKNVAGKVVRFSVNAVHPDSALGFNCWAGEHLNFICDTPFDVEAGDTLTVRVTKFNTILRSWEVHYELLKHE